MFALPDSDEAMLQAVRDVVRVEGCSGLLVDDLSFEDLDRLSWLGRAHRRAVGDALVRAAGGEVEFLVVRAPGGAPVSLGGVDYEVDPRVGSLWQLITHPPLRSLGLGTRLIGAAEQRIRVRDRGWAVLGVETHNRRAMALYGRLGYEEYNREMVSYDDEDERGRPRLRIVEMVQLCKQL